MIELHEVTKRYGSTVAVDHLRFGVRPGDAILRRTARAVAALVGVLVLTPLVSGFLPSSFQQSVTHFPAQAGMSVFGVNPDPNALSPWVGYDVLLVYVAVALAVGAILLNRHDA